MLPEELRLRLISCGITEVDEVALRQTLEVWSETWTLIKLAPWPARRWKCNYRLMMGDAMYDGQTVPEVYALAILAILAPLDHLKS